MGKRFVVIQHANSGLFAQIENRNGKQFGRWVRDYLDAQAFETTTSGAQQDALMINAYFPVTPADRILTRFVAVTDGQAYLVAL